MFSPALTSFEVKESDEADPSRDVRELSLTDLCLKYAPYVDYVNVKGGHLRGGGRYR
jgi:hypothetical protein